MCRWFQFRKDYLGICPSQFIYPLYFLKVPPTGKHLRVILLERVIWAMCVLSLFQLRALSCFSHCEVKNRELICSLLLKVCLQRPDVLYVHMERWELYVKWLYSCLRKCAEYIHLWCL